MEETIMPGETFFVKKTGKFERNDIVVFNYYGEDYSHPLEESGKFAMHWEKRVYRLIALSGDSININNTDVYVNGKHIPLPPKALLEYDLYSRVEIDDLPQREEWTQPLVETKQDTFHYLIKLTTDQAEDYRKKKPAIIKVKKRITEYVLGDTFLVKPNNTCKWSVDNFGPLIIPIPGETIFVDSTNFRLYHNVPEIQFGKNIIKEKLYFVLGDNRHGAQDSRFIGFISHSKMYGVVK